MRESRSWRPSPPRRSSQRRPSQRRRGHKAPPCSCASSSASSSWLEPRPPLPRRLLAHRRFRHRRPGPAMGLLQVARYPYRGSPPQCLRPWAGMVREIPVSLPADASIALPRMVMTHYATPIPRTVHGCESTWAPRMPSAGSRSTTALTVVKRAWATLSCGAAQTAQATRSVRRAAAHAQATAPPIRVPDPSRSRAPLQHGMSS